MSACVTLCTLPLEYMKQCTSLVLMGLLAGASVLPAASELTFDNDARPATLVLGDEDRLTSHASAGFHLRFFDGKEVSDTQLSDIIRNGNEWTVSHPDGVPSFTFRVDHYDQHLSIHLIDVQGIGTNRNYGLRLDLRTNDDVGYFPLNGLAEGKGRDWPYAINDRLTMDWRYLWAEPRSDGSHGSFVLYDATLSGAELDAALAEIWSEQNAAGHMVRPAGQASWTEADVLAWGAAYAAKFTTLSRVSLAPTTEAELYEMTDAYVIPSRASRVYLFSTVWRGEYHLDELSMIDVNPALFPNGKSDLIAYSDYLETQAGAHLQLKSLSPSVGPNDTRYISSASVDRRLASWGSGSLEDAVDAFATILRFRPDAGVTVPLRSSRSHVGGRMVYDFFRLGEEIIKVGKFNFTDDAVWVLEHCQRGYGATVPAAHSAATDMAGLYEANQMFLPELDLGEPNSLSEEICSEYAAFLDDVNVGHLHFDGAAQMQLTPWHDRDIFDYIYSQMDHPVTSSRVGESIAANFEQLFSQLKDNGGLAYHDVRVGLRLHQEGNSHIETSTSILDLHFDVSDGIMNGSRRPSFQAGQSGGELTMDILSSHGLTDEAFQLFQFWIELAPVFDDTDLGYVSGFLSADSGHWKGEDVLVLGKDGNDDYIFTPHRVMGRVSGEDALIHIDQEWGAVPRFQDISAGATLSLFNPYQVQEPQVVIRVELDSAALEDPVITINGSGTLAVEGAIQAGEYLKFTSGQSVAVYDANWNFDRSLPAVVTNFSVNVGNNEIHTASGGGGSPELRVQYITLGPVYLLESNKHL